jgi:hypothetical protein
LIQAATWLYFLCLGIQSVEQWIHAVMPDADDDPGTCLVNSSILWGCRVHEMLNADGAPETVLTFWSCESAWQSMTLESVHP